MATEKIENLYTFLKEIESFLRTCQSEKQKATITAFIENLQKIIDEPSGPINLAEFKYVLTHLHHIHRQLKSNYEDFYERDKFIKSLKEKIIKAKSWEKKLDPLSSLSNSIDQAEYENERKRYKVQKKLNEDHSFKRLLSCIAAYNTKKKNVVKTVFVSYAWPDDKLSFLEEAWTKKFIKIFAEHLGLSGIEVFLDIDQSGPGNNLDKFMDKTEDVDHVIVICNRTMKHKFKDPTKGVRNEYKNYEETYRKRSKENREKRYIIPLCLNREGNAPGFVSHFAEASIYHQGYIETLKSLIKIINKFDGEFEAEFGEKFKALQKTMDDFPLVEYKNLNMTIGLLKQAVQNFIIEEVKKSYLSKDKISNSLHEMSIKDSYIHLTLVHEEDQRRKEEKLLGKNTEDSNDNHVIFQDHRLTSFEEIYGTKELIDIKDIFNRNANEREKTAIKQVLILGRAGIGKSTLCQHLAYRWAENDLWQDKFKLVIYVPLRAIRATKYQDNRFTLANVILMECIPTNASGNKPYSLNEIENMLNSIGKSNILYILDGYDEIADKANEIEGRETPQGKLIRLLLSQENVIITSRPYYIDDYINQPERQKIFNRKLENIGFLDKDIDCYIEQFFKNITDELLPATLKQFLKQNINIRGIAHIPVNLSLICQTWKKHYAKISGHMTITILYHRLITDLSINYIKKRFSGIQINSEKEVLNHEKCKSIITFLSELAFLQSKHKDKVLIIANNDFSAILKKHAPLSRDEVLKFGLLKSTDEDTLEDDKSYYFLHLTFQEFFAAYYISNNLEKDDIADFIKTQKYNRSYEIVWCFVCGLLKEKNPAILEKFFDILEDKPKDICGLYHLTLMMRCIDECFHEIDPGRKDNFLKNLAQWINCVVNKRSLKTIEIISNYLKLSQNIFKDNYIIQVFKSLLKNTNVNIRYSTAEALGNQSSLSDDILEQLVKLLKENERYVVKALIKQSSLSDKILDQLTDLLNNTANNYVVKSNAAQILGKQSSLSDKILAQLVKVISTDKDINVKYNAAEVLGKQSSLTDEILGLLVNLLKNTDKEVSYYAAHALGKQSSLPSEILGKFANLLKDEEINVNVKFSVVVALSWQQSSLPPKSFQLFLNLLENTDEKIRIDIVDRLYLQSFLSSEILSRLINLLKNTNEHVKICALRTLLAHSPLSSEILTQLVNLLKNTNDESIGCYVAQILQKNSSLSIEILNQLADLLKDEDVNVKYSAVKALKYWESSLSPEILQLLVNLLEQTDQKLSYKATQALRTQFFLSRKILDQLVNIISTDKFVNIKYNAAKVLGEQSSLSEKILSPLVNLLKNTDEDVSSYAVMALGAQSSLPSEILDQLANLLKDKDVNVKYFAGKALNWQSSLSPKLFQLLVNLLEKTDQILSYKAAQALNLNKQSSFEVLSQLANLLKYKDVNIKYFTVNYLDGPFSSSTKLFQLLVGLLENTDQRGRVYVAGVLNQLSFLSSEILGQLANLLKDKAKRVRYSAAEALGEQSSLSYETLNRLIDLLNNTDRDVSAHAAQALGYHSFLFFEISHQLVNLLKYEDKNDSEDWWDDSEDMDAQVSAEFALRDHSFLSSEIFNRLINLLHNTVGNVSAYAANVLDTFSSKILSQLGNLLKDENIFVKWAVAEGLFAQSSLHPKIVSQLIYVLLTDSEVRDWAEKALCAQSFLSDKNLSQLGKLLENEDSAVICSAATVLDKQSSLSIEILGQLANLVLKHTDKYVQKKAADVLKSQPIANIINSVNKDLNIIVVYIIIKSLNDKIPICISEKENIIFMGNTHKIELSTSEEKFKFIDCFHKNFMELTGIQHEHAVKIDKNFFNNSAQFLRENNGSTNSTYLKNLGIYVSSNKRSSPNAHLDVETNPPKKQKREGSFDDVAVLKPNINTEFLYKMNQSHSTQNILPQEVISASGRNNENNPQTLQKSWCEFFSIEEQKRKRETSSSVLSSENHQFFM